MLKQVLEISMLKQLVPKALVGTKFWHCSVVLQDHHSTSEILHCYMISKWGGIMTFYKKIIKFIG
jgi:hypothetical protein